MEYSPDLFADAEIVRDREIFLRQLVRELSGILEEAVGLEDAQGFIAVVGSRIGEVMNAEYQHARDGTPLSVEEIAAALVDLKRRIEGEFSVESIENGRITLVNSACPFGEYVEGRESLCMMTSNVFGRIAAANQDYARVSLDKTIARGDGMCRVVVDFAEGDGGREYFG